MLQPKVIDNLTIMLQVNPQESSYEYYTHRGFTLLNTPMQVIKDKSLPGQYIHWIDDDYLKVLVLKHNPNGLKCDKAHVPGLRQCLLLSTKNSRQGKNFVLDDNTTNIMLTKFNTIICDKLRLKKLNAFKDIHLWYDDAHKYYNIESDEKPNESLVMGTFPAPAIISCEIVEKFCIDVDFSSFCF